MMHIQDVLVPTPCIHACLACVGNAAMRQDDVRHLYMFDDADFEVRPKTLHFWTLCLLHSVRHVLQHAPYATLVLCFHSALVCARP